MILNRPGVLLRLEGAAIAAVIVSLYARSGDPWLRFVLLLLAPDLAFAAYAAGPAVGAAVYNLVHTYAAPVLLAVAGLLSGSDLAVSLALIWGTHISADRLLGYGLKYPTAFRDTHLQRV